MIDIRFGDLKIGRIRNASGVYAGSNGLAGRTHASKRNQAFGSVRGANNRFTELRMAACDRDAIDMHASREREEC